MSEMSLQHNPILQLHVKTREVIFPKFHDSSFSVSEVASDSSIPLFTSNVRTGYYFFFRTRKNLYQLHYVYPTMFQLNKLDSIDIVILRTTYFSVTIDVSSP
jgi:hypothetical protein